MFYFHFVMWMSWKSPNLNFLLPGSVFYYFDVTEKHQIVFNFFLQVEMFF